MLNLAKNIKPVQSRFSAGNKIFYILFFVFASLFCNAQTNLVYNGDFELYDTCPNLTSSPGDDQVRYCLGWKCPTGATSDYYNTCASSVVDIPMNIGYQWPYSGNAYCGVLLQYYAQSPNPVENGWWVEYIQSKLTAPLQAGYEYEFSCNVVLNDVLHDYAFWKFGAYFSQYPISKMDAKPFTDIVPQVMNTTNNFITDTLNWQTIKGKFIAHGAEEYITIGFFLDTLAPDTLRQNTGFAIDPTNTGGYYYIDACSMFETGRVFEYPNVFSPNGDNENDEWKPFLAGGETVKIYNRWGIKVFELSESNQSWDGRTTSGQECVNGVYYFVVLNKDQKDSITKKGFIQLVR